MRFVKARPGPKNTVIYVDENGKEYVASGGDRNWRNNNPGNLEPGNISKRNGQIGVAGKFAVFPSPEIGHQALLDSLKTFYMNKDLKQTVKSYAPKIENDIVRYLRFLQKRTGVKDNRKLKDFSSSEFEKLWKAIEDMEGKKKPIITPVLNIKKQITKVRKNKKGTIIAYFVEGIGWFSKTEGIKLAQRGEIDAVVSTSRSGNLYIKTRPDVYIDNNLDNLG